jgi:hypothetical protein
MKTFKMSKIALIALLILQTVSLMAYTIYVGSEHGWNFLDVAISNISSLTWNGQFGLDFSSYLVLSGIWIMWRNCFSLKSILIAALAMIVGIIIFAPYFLFLMVKEKGDICRVLIGNRN